ncbi:uncharacterized protein KQ657_001055 [Scheffersomyces spartinae]|uniref:Uncharacterized protein n=1 Tax=Scheffersomyces spartinae TaxID=45513 RepID=A0A9P8AIM8_9ASCO|nr:uncharacterized protein KQ657_001055 [Scheffersomyces spartinae]KAG7193291.1 hypothetical protein KQ657_001055 [Scheffersomyces spartinae]
MPSLPTYLHPSVVINPPPATSIPDHADPSSPVKTSQPPDTSVFDGTGPSEMLVSPMRKGHRHRRSQAISGDFDFLSQINQNPLFPPPGPNSPTRNSYCGSPSSPTPSYLPPRLHSRSQSALLGYNAPQIKPRPVSCYTPSKSVHNSNYDNEDIPKLLDSTFNQSIPHNNNNNNNVIGFENTSESTSNKLKERSGFLLLDIPPQTAEAMSRNFDVDVNGKIETMSVSESDNAGWFSFPPPPILHSPRKTAETSQPVTPKLSSSSFYPPQRNTSQDMGSGSTPSTSHFASGSLNGSPYYYSSPRDLRSPFHKKALSASYNEVPDPIIDLNDILVAAASGSGSQAKSPLNTTSTPVSPARGLRSSHSTFLHRRTELLPPTLESLLQSPFARNYSSVGGASSSLLHNGVTYPEQAIEEEEDTDFEEENHVNSTPNINQQSEELEQEVQVSQKTEPYANGLEIVGVHVDDDEDDEEEDEDEDEDEEDVDVDDNENATLVVSQDSLQPPRGLSSRRSDEFDNLYPTLANSSSTSLPNSKPPPIEKTFSNTSNASLSSKRSQARATRYQSFYDQSFKISNALKLNYSSDSLSHSSSLSSLRNKYSQQQLIPQNSLQSLLPTSKPLSPAQPPFPIGQHSRDASSSQTSINSESSFSVQTPIIYQSGTFGGISTSPSLNALNAPPCNPASIFVAIPLQQRLSLPRMNEYKRAIKPKTTSLNANSTMTTKTLPKDISVCNSPSSSNHSTTLVTQESSSPSLSITSPPITITSHTSSPPKTQQTKPKPIDVSQTSPTDTRLSTVAHDSNLKKSHVDVSSRRSLAHNSNNTTTTNTTSTPITPSEGISSRKVADVTNLPRYNTSAALAFSSRSHRLLKYGGGGSGNNDHKMSVDSSAGSIATRTSSRTSIGDRSKRKQFIDWLKRK